MAIYFSSCKWWANKIPHFICPKASDTIASLRVVEFLVFSYIWYWLVGTWPRPPLVHLWDLGNLNPSTNSLFSVLQTAQTSPVEAASSVFLITWCVIKYQTVLTPLMKPTVSVSSLFRSKLLRCIECSISVQAISRSMNNMYQSDTAIGQVFQSEKGVCLVSSAYWLF